MFFPALWRAKPSHSYNGPKIVLIHGFMAGQHMQRHLLQFLREAGYEDTSLYSNHQSPASIAKQLLKTLQPKQPLVLIGYSQGGSQVLKVAKILQKQDIDCDLVISLAAGGLGRLYPPQWGFNMRKIPSNIKRYLNYFAANDKLGTDRKHAKNLAQAQNSSTHLENIAYDLDARVDHISIVRCYPAERVIPHVQELFLNRLLQELQQLTPTR